MQSHHLRKLLKIRLKTREAKLSLNSLKETFQGNTNSHSYHLTFIFLQKRDTIRPRVSQKAQKDLL